ncbi:MAG: hypothetical protein MHM6MM_003426 [Cercozoa sp. M6MM]
MSTQRLLNFEGEIQLITGPMFSGKSTELFRRLKRYEIACKKVLLVKYARDTRYSASAAATHDQQTFPAIGLVKLEELMDNAEYLKQVKECDVVGIDEGQFFPDVVTVAERLANLGKIVVISLLNGTFRREGFETALGLFAIAESITSLRAVCMVCYNEGAFSKRLAASNEVELIGGTDAYASVCRRCYFASSSKPLPSQEMEAVVNTPIKQRIERVESRSRNGEVSPKKLTYQEEQSAKASEAGGATKVCFNPSAFSSDSAQLLKRRRHLFVNDNAGNSPRKPAPKRRRRVVPVQTSYLPI